MAVGIDSRLSPFSLLFGLREQSPVQFELRKYVVSTGALVHFRPEAPFGVGKGREGKGVTKEGMGSSKEGSGVGVV